MRQKLAAACRSMLAEVAPVKLSPDLAAGLSRRMRQTLEHLLGGDSEKEVATKLNGPVLVSYSAWSAFG
jgi:hypothetical protein